MRKCECESVWHAICIQFLCYSTGFIALGESGCLHVYHFCLYISMFMARKQIQVILKCPSVFFTNINIEWSMYVFYSEILVTHSCYLCMSIFILFLFYSWCFIFPNLFLCIKLLSIFFGILLNFAFINILFTLFFFCFCCKIQSYQFSL